ncbi:hypothetical protein AMELA_G00204340 [Ameiurus melas]|uniref:Uncharacterized protein n=1 Tax=Ameiurus melas TaxID=219545 RepID=A0A7J6A4P0_AMEME|nr:hypothetical protein AMELA_G00204340 [Ameiurus melas]
MSQVHCGETAQALLVSIDSKSRSETNRFVRSRRYGSVPKPTRCGMLRRSSVGVEEDGDGVCTRSYTESPRVTELRVSSSTASELQSRLFFICDSAA